MTFRSSASAPLIGITADQAVRDPSALNAGEEALLSLPTRYCRAIEEAGGVPVVLPSIVSKANVQRLLQRLDGVLISGGNFDIHPRHYGEKAIPELGELKEQRTEFELELAKSAFGRDLPLLGICGGAQAINVALGGSLYQDIASQLPNAAEHQLGAKKTTGGHAIEVKAGTRLYRILGRRSVEVNTTHHQAVKNLGKGLVVNAIARDGLIEGIENPAYSFVLGVQWHPEVLAPRFAHQRKIFSAFVSACRRLRRGS